MRQFSDSEQIRGPSKQNRTCYEMRANNLNAVEKVLAVLGLFDESKLEWTLTEMQKTLGMPKSSLHWITSILVGNNYLQKDEVSRAYRPGPGLLALADACSEGYALRRVALPFLKELSRETKGTTALRIRLGVHSVALAVVNSDEPLHVRYKPGEKLPINLGAPGKVLLAYIPLDEVIALSKKGAIKKVTLASITDLPTLEKELRKIRLKGFAFSDGEAISGARAVAAPIRDFTEDVVASLVLAFPAISLPRNRIPQVAGQVIRYAGEISKALGYRDRKSKAVPN